MVRYILLLVFMIATPLHVNAQTRPDPPPYDYIGYHLQEINRLRAEAGLQPFAYNAQLEQAANVQADWMIVNWSYADYHGGSTPTTRAVAAGYSDYDWCCTENTFLSPTRTPEGALRFWLRSAPHYRQLMSDEYDEIGVGFAVGAARTGQVIVFGRRNPLPGATPEPQAPAPTESPPAVVAVEQPSTQAGCSTQHIIQPGENLFRISLRYRVSQAALAHANGITDPRLIFAGQRLCIPSGSVPATNLVEQTTPLDAPQSAENWCYAGQPWGDGRCDAMPTQAERDFMWRCGWYRAQGVQAPACEG